MRRLVPVLSSLQWFSLLACSSRALYPITVKDAGADAVTGADVAKGTDLATAKDVAASPDAPVQLDLARGADGPLDGNPSDALVPDAGTDLGADAPSGASDAEVPSDVRDKAPVDAPFQTMLAIDPASAQPWAVLVEGRFESPIPVVLTVKNTGTTPTGALQAALAGAMPSYYRIDGDTCSGLSLPPQASCTIAVAFTPPFEGKYGDASLVVGDTTTGESVTATLHGDYLMGDCLWGTLEVDLGPALPGTVGQEAMVTVKNGCATLDMSSITIWITDSNIRIATDTCTKQTVPPKGECVFGLELAAPPGAEQGLVSCTVQIATDLGWWSVVARGKVVGDSDPLAANPSSVSFDTVGVSQSATRTVTITNYGSVATKPLSVSLFVTRITQASITGTTCTGVLAAGAPCQVTVQYLPLDTAGISGTITVTDGTHSIDVSVRGFASSPVVDGSIDATEGVDALSIADIRGRTYQIAASKTPPNASGPRGGACTPADTAATYDLVFSADGSEVQIIRTDAVQEPMRRGKLQYDIGTSLSYDLEGSLSGKKLEIWVESGVFVANLSDYYSGACIQSPMTPS